MRRNQTDLRECIIAVNKSKYMPLCSHLNIAIFIQSTPCIIRETPFSLKSDVLKEDRKSPCIVPLILETETNIVKRD